MPAGIDAGSRTELDDHRVDVDGDVVDPRRALPSWAAEHGRVVGTAGHDRRLGHRLEQRHRRRPHGDRSTAGAVQPRHVAVGEKRAPARLQSGDPDHRQLGEPFAVAPAPSTTTVDRQPIARKRRSSHSLRLLRDDDDRGRRWRRRPRQRQRRVVAARNRGRQPRPGRSSSPTGRATSLVAGLPGAARRRWRSAPANVVAGRPG